MKKKIYKLTTTLCVLFVLSSCNDFLERSAQDLIIPSTVAQYKELLQGEGYFKDFNNKTYFLNYMTDDMEYIDYQVEGLYTNSDVEIYNYIYCWMKEIENDSFTDGLYAWLYSQVLVANTCLDGLDKAKGTEDEKNVLKGQSLFQRAYAYFILVNTYGYPYNSASVENECMPLRLDPTPSSSVYKRESSRVIWEQIEKDIQQAAELLYTYVPKNNFEINGRAALLLASRVALYMEKYTEAEQYADRLLTLYNKLYDISDKGVVEPSSTRTADYIGFIDNNTNPEILWNFCATSSRNFSDQFDNLTLREVQGFRVSTSEPEKNEHSLMDTYLPDINKTIDKFADKRRAYFFNISAYFANDYEEHQNYEMFSALLMFGYLELWPGYLYNNQPLKWDKNDSKNTLMQAFRTAEAYLNIAEAYARQANPDTDKALYYLNKLRENRIANYRNLTMADFSSTEELVQFIWDERRRELCFEECHRWWDLRRTTQPELKHKWTNGETYTLKQGDEAYILSIPQLERNFDTGIINKRPVRIAD